MHLIKDKDFIGVLLFIVISLITFIGGYRLSRGTFSEPGPGFFPFYLSIILIILSSGLFIKFIRKRIQREELLEFKGRNKKIFLAVLGLFGYLLTLKIMGFIISGILILTLLLKFVEERTWKLTLIIVLTCTAISFIFGKYLGIPFPKGILGF